MPHFTAPALDTVLREARTPDLAQALGIVRGLATAVHAAHQRGIVHHGLHPRDVFVEPNGTTRVTGFGIARLLAAVGVRVPTRRPYSAPELLSGGQATPASDLFSLGTLAFELISGRRPAGLGADAVAHLELPLSADAQQQVRTILAAMLAENPAHRPANAAAFAQALTHALAEVVPNPGAADYGEPPAAAVRQGAPPTDAELRLFATQGTLWEAPRPSEAWQDPIEIEDAPDSPPDELRFREESAADQGSAYMAFAMTPLEEIDTGEVWEEAPEEVRDEPRRAREPLEAAEDDDATRPGEPPAAQGSSLLGLNQPADYGAFRDDDMLVPEPAPVPEAADRREERSVEPPTFGHARPPAEPAESSSPPAVVLALTLALGLAIGGAGGYLLGLRGSTRASDQMSAVRDPQAPGAPPVAVIEEPPVPRPEGSSDPAVPAAAPRPAPDTARPVAEAPEPAVSRPAERQRPAPAAGELIIRSTPTKAGVLVNNAWRGRTPLTLRGLSLGTHTIRVTERGYNPETRRVALNAQVPSATVAVQLERVAAPAARADATPPARPGATTGSLYVESRPAGARVFIDDRLVGTSPLLVSEVAPGTRAIRLEVPGHRSWTTRVSVTAGQRQRVAASLEEGQ